MIFEVSPAFRGILILPKNNTQEKTMDFYKVPIGFGMALAMNAPAMEAYAAMTEQQKQAVLKKAHNARSEKEMQQIVASLANPMM